ncbi:MAG: diguanylate cyclase [Phycisphaerae bacterium]
MESRSQCPRMLVVEDDPDQRALLVEALEIYYGESSEGRIESVGTVEECFAKDIGRFDIVLSDYHIGLSTGLDVLQRIHANWDVPVVIVTSENNSNVAIEAIRQGAQDYVVKLGDYLFALPVIVDKAIRQHRIRQENDHLQRRLQKMLDALQDKNAKLESAMKKLQTLATTDALTGLANRRRFREVLDRMFNEADRYGHDLTCCMCDLDRYKQLNDTLGHQVGDEMLQIASDVIRSSLRASDVAARYGGDEFVLLFPHTPMDQAEAVCRRIRRRMVAMTRHFAAQGVNVTLSVGIASRLADNAASADALICMADRALYGAKEQGKDRIVTYGSMNHDQAHSD